MSGWRNYFFFLCRGVSKIRRVIIENCITLRQFSGVIWVSNFTMGEKNRMLEFRRPKIYFAERDIHDCLLKDE